MIIDANIFLEIILAQEKSERCKIFLRDILNGDKKAAMLSVSIDSIVIVMLRNDLESAKIKVFLESLIKYRGLKFYRPNIKDRVNALNHIKTYGLDYEDALVLQCAVSTNSKEIVSFDKHFDKVKEAKRIEP